MSFFASPEEVGVQLLILKDSGRILYDIPKVTDFMIDAKYDVDLKWPHNAVTELIFSMVPLFDHNSNSYYTIYDEERMREGNQYFRNERAEVQAAVKELPYVNKGMK